MAPETYPPASRGGLSRGQIACPEVHCSATASLFSHGRGWWLTVGCLQMVYIWCQGWAGSLLLTPSAGLLENPPAMYLEKEMAAHSRVLAWRIPGTEEPGGLQSTGSQRVRNDWSDLAEAASSASLKGWESWQRAVTASRGCARWLAPDTCVRWRFITDDRRDGRGAKMASVF